MLNRKIILYIGIIISALCLTIGYGFSKHWIGSLAAVLMIPAWLLARKYANSGLPLICLLVFLSLAVIGQLTGSSPLWTICGSGLALAVWDLLLLDTALDSNSVSEHTQQYEKEHLQSLAFALCTGLFVVFVGRPVTLKIPFVLLLLFVVVAVFTLDRTFSQIKKSRIDR